VLHMLNIDAAKLCNQHASQQKPYNLSSCNGTQHTSNTKPRLSLDILNCVLHGLSQILAA